MLTATASHCYSFMKLSWADAKELRSFCYMALCYTRIEDARNRYSMFFIQPQKLFYPFSYQEKMSFCESRKNRLDLNKISFQKTCLCKPGQYIVRVHSYIVLNLTKTFLCYTLRFERHKVRKMFIMYRLFSKPSLKIRIASAIFWNYLGIFRYYG